MLRVYTALLRLLTPFIVARLAWRGLRNPDYWHRVPERFGFIPPVRSLRVIWLHAVSVGEVRATRPLIETLREHYPEHRIVLTTMTPTGSAMVKQLFDAEVDHYYVPYDLPGAVQRFLDHIRPEIAIVMETELWPNIFATCRARAIPILVANMRMSESALRRYQRFGALTRATLHNVSVLAAQSPADAKRISALGAPAEAIHITGSIKFEINLPASLREAADVLRGEWGRDRPVWLAASTHEGEEELLLKVRFELTHRFPDLLFVLVPRHPERFGPVARLCRRAGCKLARRSEQRGAVERSVNVLLGDTMGELQLFYGAADLAFIGGSLVPTGGHNLLESAAVGTPVIFGPSMFNFEEVSRLALEHGAGMQVANANELAPVIADLLADPNRRFEAGEAGKRMVDQNRGAVARTLDLIDRLMRESGS